MNPKDFLNYLYNSVMSNNEAEVVAQNIMVILWRTGNRFRELSWDEYKRERLEDGNFTKSEKVYFDKVIQYCISANDALKFSPTWNIEL